MIISEVIKKLEELKEIHGDKPVVTHDHIGGGAHCVVTDVGYWKEEDSVYIDGD